MTFKSLDQAVKYYELSGFVHSHHIGKETYMKRGSMTIVITNYDGVKGPKVH